MEGLTLRSGAAAIGLGNAAVAVSVAAMLFVGPRALSPSSFAGLAVAWTITTVFGFGLAVPLEQVWTRRLAAGAGRGTPHPWVLVAAALVALIGVVPWAAVSPVTSGLSGFVPSVGTGLVGWAIAARVRSGLAGRAALGRYALALALEASCRLTLVGCAAVVQDGAWLLAASVGVPLLVSGCAAVGAAPAAAPRPRRRASRLEVPSVMGAAFGYQLCLNGIPLLLSTVGAAPAPLVGAFVLANSYLRIPTVLAGGFATQTLVREGAAGTAHPQSSRMAAARRDVLVATSLAAAIVVGLLAVSGPVLTLVLGRTPGLDTSALVALAASSVAAVAAAVLTATFVGSGRAHVAVAAWASGALATVVLVVADHGHFGSLLAAGILVGPAVALAMLGIRFPRSHSDRAH